VQLEAAAAAGEAWGLNSITDWTWSWPGRAWKKPLRTGATWCTSAGPSGPSGITITVAAAFWCRPKSRLSGPFPARPQQPASTHELERIVATRAKAAHLVKRIGQFSW